MCVCVQFYVFMCLSLCVWLEFECIQIELKLEILEIRSNKLTKSQKKVGQKSSLSILKSDLFYLKALHSNQKVIIGLKYLDLLQTKKMERGKIKRPVCSISFL